MSSNSRTNQSAKSDQARNLVNEFKEGADDGQGNQVLRQGIAAVLQYIVETKGMGLPRMVPCSELTELIASLSTPSLFDRALSGDKESIKDLLLEAGIVDSYYNLVPPYRFLGDS